MEGFDPKEARDLMAMCTSFTFMDLYQSDTEILPNGCSKTYTSPIIGMDNMFVIFEKEGKGIICFRGSTSKAVSWVENFYSAMIPAKGIIKINQKEIPYLFGQDTSAGVHSGYALAVVALSSNLIQEIQNLNKKGIYEIYITGHSQGGAIATLTRPFLENLKGNKIDTKNQFKNYAFANPMSGNKEFVREFNRLYCESNSSFNIHNKSDMVPKMPMHYDDEEKLISAKRFTNIVFGKEKFDVAKFGTELLLRTFEKGLSKYIQSSNRFIEKVISKTYTAIDMPKYLSDINFYHTANTFELNSFEYPKIKIDVSKLTEDEIGKLKRSEDGNYYQEEPSFFQHKPYNYFVGILKKYFPQDYKNLKINHLTENL